MFGSAGNSASVSLAGLCSHLSLGTWLPPYPRKQATPWRPCSLDACSFYARALPCSRTECLRMFSASPSWPVPRYRASLMPIDPFMWHTFLGHLLYARPQVSAAIEFTVVVGGADLQR